eukprot:gene23446-biopygen16360
MFGRFGSDANRTPPGRAGLGQATPRPVGPGRTGPDQPAVLPKFLMLSPSPGRGWAGMWAQSGAGAPAFVAWSYRNA